MPDLPYVSYVEPRRVQLVVMPSSPSPLGASEPAKSAGSSFRRILRPVSVWTGLGRKNQRSSQQISRPHVSSPAPGHFPFLSLPRELREMVYDYFRQPQSDILLLKVEDESSNFEVHDQGPVAGDPVFLHSPENSGLLAYHGTFPPLALQLVCHQVHAELFDHFFEVGPLTPHADEWRFDPTYARLATSSRLPLLSKVLIRVELASLRMEKHLGELKYEEIGLEDCVLKLQPLAEMLVRVLRKHAKNLSLVVIDWKDDFGQEQNWELKTSILFPLATLKNVRFQVGKILVEQGAKAKAEQVLEETLEGLCAGG